MLIAARAMQARPGLLKPYLAQSGVKAAGKVAIGTVKGDLHDIGKNLVGMMLKAPASRSSIWAPTWRPTSSWRRSRNNGAQVVALSALLTTTMPNMMATVEALKAAGLRDKVKVMIGGAPVTEAYAKQIGADGYSADASRAVRDRQSPAGVTAPPAATPPEQTPSFPQNSGRGSAQSVDLLFLRRPAG